MHTQKILRKFVLLFGAIAIALVGSTMEAKAQNVSTPTINTPTVETPTVETPIIETPIVETPIVETPIVETPIVETPTGGDTASVPEPSTTAGLLVVSALAGGLMWQRQKLPH